MDLFGTVGVVCEVTSALMGAAGMVTGCGPAFVDLMIEAYANTAVKYGVPRGRAYALVAQMIKGSAALALETKEQPGVLNDAVCSPGGTTIRGVCSLEEDGFRAACIHSIDAILESQQQRRRCRSGTGTGSLCRFLMFPGRFLRK